MPQAFIWATRHYLSLRDYKAALASFAVPAWIGGLTIHHTYRPTQADWRGRRSMDALERYYRGTLKWPAGPHLFLAPDGLWAGTPLASPGVHAGACNADHIGLEVVGDFDRAPWDVGLRERVYQLIVILLQWAGLTERVLHGHRECMSPKTCPGATIALDIVREHVQSRLFDRRFIVTAPGARVRLFPRANSVVVASNAHGMELSAHPVKGARHQGDARWARVKLPNGAIGHVWAPLGRWEAV